MTDSGQSAKARQALLLHLAQQEGKLFVYSTTSSGIVGQVAQFESLYPFIKVTYLQGPPSVMIPPIETSDASGNYNWDVIMQTQIYELLLRQIGAIQPYYTPSPKLVPNPQVNNIYGPNGLVWGEGYATLVAGFMYNKGIISQPPTGILDAESSRFAGKVDLPNSAGGQQWVAAVEADLGQAKATQFFQTVSSTGTVKLSALAGSTLISQVAAGQLGADADAQLSTVNADIAAGSNVGWVPFASATNIVQNMISAHAPDIGAALLWADYVMSKAGQAEETAQSVLPVTFKLPKTTKAEGAYFYPYKIKGLTAYKFNALTTDWRRNVINKYWL